MRKPTPLRRGPVLAVAGAVVAMAVTVAVLTGPSAPVDGPAATGTPASHELPRSPTGRPTASAAVASQSTSRGASTTAGDRTPTIRGSVGGTTTPGAPTTTTGGSGPPTVGGPVATTTTGAPVPASDPWFHGVYEYAGNNSTADAADPDVAGVVLDYYWSQIEPTKGQYDWSVIDSAMAPWVANGKKVILRIATAGQSSWDAPYSGSGTPAWVYADGAPSVTDSGETVPVYWSPVYLADLSTFLAAYGAAFDGNPHVSLVEAGVGMGGETMPETNLSPEGLGLWQAAGYSSATWLNTVETISSEYRADFPHTPVYALLTSSFLGGDWPSYQALAAWYANASPPWDLQNDALSSTLTLPDPTAWARASGLALEQAQPTSRSGDTLASDTADALALHAGYVLVYRSDVDQAGAGPTLAALATLATPS